MKSIESIKLKQVCPLCGNEVGELGSMTQWLFRETRCHCEPEKVDSQLSEKVTTQRGLVRRDSLRIVDTLGMGGMGTVYKVFDEQLGREFALKVLKRELMADKFAVRRFQHEARAAMQLTHPHIASCYAQGMTEDGLPFLLMDLVEGESLAEILTFNQILEPSRALEILIQVTEAVEYAHKNGVVHRDIKPENVLISRQCSELVKLIDFGIARLMTEANGKKKQTVTQSGEILGSPDYMSPEQCLGEPTDYRTDIYSLGCLAYVLATGRPPFFSNSPVKTVVGHVSEPVPMPLSATPLSQMLEKVIKVALQKKPHWRYQSASAMLADLKLLQHNKPPINAEQKLAQIEQQQDTINYFPGTGLPKAESGLGISGAAVLCCAFGAQSQIALAIGMLLMVASLITWYRYLYKITCEARTKELILRPGKQPSLSPIKSVLLSVACTNGQVVLGTVLLCVAGLIFCAYFSLRPVFSYLKSFGNSLITASGPLLLVVISVAAVLAFIIGYAFLVVWLNSKQFQTLASVYYPDARFDRTVDHLCWQLGFSFLLTPLGFAAFFNHSQIGLCCGTALPALNCFVAFWLTGRLLRYLDLKTTLSSFIAIEPPLSNHFD